MSDANRERLQPTRGCKHYEREEIDFYLVLTREMLKLTRCKGCGLWLERVIERKYIATLTFGA